MVPVLSIRHPGTDLRTALFILGFSLVDNDISNSSENKYEECLNCQNAVPTFETSPIFLYLFYNVFPKVTIQITWGKICCYMFYPFLCISRNLFWQFLSLSLSPMVSSFKSLSLSLVCPTCCISFLSSILGREPSWVSLFLALSLSLFFWLALLLWLTLKNHSDLFPHGSGPLV